MDRPEVALAAEAAEWRLLALLFEYPAGDWRRHVAALVNEVTSPDLRQAAAKAPEQVSEGLYLALFGPGGPVPLREAAHLGGVQLGYLMAELAAQYDAFGYAPRTQEPHDHLSVEAGFVAYLKIKQAYALACGDAEHAAIAAEAAAAFVKEHMARMAEPVLNALNKAAPEYLVHAGRFLLAQAGPCPRSTWPLVGLHDDDAMNCGVAPAEELIQLEP